MEVSYKNSEIIITDNTKVINKVKLEDIAKRSSAVFSVIKNYFCIEVINKYMIGEFFYGNT